MSSRRSRSTCGTTESAVSAGGQPSPPPLALKRPDAGASGRRRRCGDRRGEDRGRRGRPPPTVPGRTDDRRAQPAIRRPVWTRLCLPPSRRPFFLSPPRRQARGPARRRTQPARDEIIQPGGHRNRLFLRLGVGGRRRCAGAGGGSAVTSTWRGSRLLEPFFSLGVTLPHLVRRGRSRARRFVARWRGRRELPLSRFGRCCPGPRGRNVVVTEEPFAGARLVPRQTCGAAPLHRLTHQPVQSVGRDSLAPLHGRLGRTGGRLVGGGRLQARSLLVLVLPFAGRRRRGGFLHLRFRRRLRFGRPRWGGGRLRRHRSERLASELDGLVGLEEDLARQHDDGDCTNCGERRQGPSHAPAPPERRSRGDGPGLDRFWLFGCDSGRGRAQDRLTRARRRLIGIEGAAGGGARALERRQLCGAAGAPRQMRLDRGAVVTR